jgi:hypothetical protein
MGILGFKNQKPKILNFEYINQVVKIVNQKLQMTKPKTKNQFFFILNADLKLVNVATYMFNCNVLCKQICPKNADA